MAGTPEASTGDGAEAVPLVIARWALPSPPST
jgi:hypothetical protein